jgi:hypothetical protein
LKLVGGELKEVVHSYAIFSPKFQVLSVGTPKKRGSYIFSGNPRRSYGSVERGEQLA